MYEINYFSENEEAKEAKEEEGEEDPQRLARRHTLSSSFRYL